MTYYRFGAPILAQPFGDGITLRTSENARRMTVFFGAPSPKDGQVKYGGTGFLALHKEEGFGFGYLITARHVAAQVKQNADIVVRINLKDGGSRPLLVDNISWAFHPDETVDAAVTPCMVTAPEYDVAYYDLAESVDPKVTPHRVQCGDPICIVGLFHWHSGVERNTPIVHSGNIALLPDPKERIPIVDRTTGGRKLIEGYLVEAQTFEGLSGAPVFQREPVTLSQYPKHNGSHPIVLTGAQFLGIYAGAWEGEPSKDLAEDRKWGPDKRIPAGMGLVVPVAKIMEIILNDEGLKKERADLHARRAKENAAVEDSGLSQPVPTNAALTGKEGFNALLGEAARKQKTSD